MIILVNHRDDDSHYPGHYSGEKRAWWKMPSDARVDNVFFHLLKFVNHVCT